MSLMILRAARPDEATKLSALALRSKGHWGYDETFLEACRAELTIRPETVKPHRTTVAEHDDQVIGFVTMEGHPPVGELGYLYVDPGHLGQGVGRTLWQHAVTTAESAGLEKFKIDADPHACDFYLAMGAILVGATPSGSIPGRSLPLLHYALR